MHTIIVVFVGIDFALAWLDLDIERCSAAAALLCLRIVHDTESWPYQFFMPFYCGAF